ncbi:hypothetical protein BH11PAT1_BH11PAT1_0530 [soil metagenome]
MSEGSPGVTLKDLQPKSVSRRTMLKGLVGVVSAGGVVALRKISHFTNSPKEKQYTFVPPVDITPDQAELDRQLANEKLGEIKELPLMNEQRMLLEKGYVEWADTLDKIDRGFWALGRKVNRAELLKKRFQLRQTGHPELAKLPSAMIEWANKEGIHPEVLGVCLDAAPTALKLIDTLKPQLREDFKGRETELAKKPASQFMLSPGGMTALIAYETGRSFSDDYNRKMGFSFIGGDLAKNNYSGDNYHDSGLTKLQEVCAVLQQDTGLNFSPDNVQGSENPEPNNPKSSGGALGIQMMPDRVLEIYNLTKGIVVNGKSDAFNPFDLTSSVIGSWVFLAQHLNMGKNDKGENLWRWGVDYERLQKSEKDADDLQVRPALEKWNGLKEEMDFIFKADKSYRQQFPPKAAE